MRLSVALLCLVCLGGAMAAETGVSVASTLELLADRMDKLEKIVASDHKLKEAHANPERKVKAVPHPASDAPAASSVFQMPVGQKLVLSVTRYKLDEPQLRGRLLKTDCKLVVRNGAAITVLESFALPEFTALPMNWWSHKMEWDDFPTDKNGNAANAVMCEIKSGNVPVGFFTAHAGERNDNNIPLTNGRGGVTGAVGVTLYRD